MNEKEAAAVEHTEASAAAEPASSGTTLSVEEANARARRVAQLLATAARRVVLQQRNSSVEQVPATA